MPVIKHMAPHPSREGHMVRNVVSLITALLQPGGLRRLVGIQETDLEPIQAVCRRRRPDFTGRHRVSAQKEVFSIATRLDRPLDGFLDHPMPPLETPLRGASEHAQFGRFEDPRKLGFNQTADRGLTYAAGSGNEKKHGCRVWF